MKCEFCDWYRLWLREGTSRPVYDPTMSHEPPVPEEIRSAWTEGCEPYLADQGWMRACDAIAKLTTEEDPEESSYLGPFRRVRHKMLGLSDEEIRSELYDMVSESRKCPTCSREPRGMTLNESEFFIQHELERSKELSQISPQELGERLCSDTPERDIVNYALAQQHCIDVDVEDPAHRPMALAHRAEVRALHMRLNASAQKAQHRAGEETDTTS